PQGGGALGVVREQERHVLRELAEGPGHVLQVRRKVVESEKLQDGGAVSAHCGVSWRSGSAATGRGGTGRRSRSAAPGRAWGRAGRRCGGASQRQPPQPEEVAAVADAAPGLDALVGRGVAPGGAAPTA